MGPIWLFVEILGEGFWFWEENQWLEEKKKKNQKGKSKGKNVFHQQEKHYPREAKTLPSKNNNELKYLTTLQTLHIHFKHIMSQHFSFIQSQYIPSFLIFKY